MTPAALASQRPHFQLGAPSTRSWAATPWESRQPCSGDPARQERADPGLQLGFLSFSQTPLSSTSKLAGWGQGGERERKESKELAGGSWGSCLNRVQRQGHPPGQIQHSSTTPAGKFPAPPGSFLLLSGPACDRPSHLPANRDSSSRPSLPHQLQRANSSPCSCTVRTDPSARTICDRLLPNPRL